MDGQLWEDREGVGLFSAMCQVAAYPYRGSGRVTAWKRAFGDRGRGEAGQWASHNL